jgi:HlyD family secretion protein
VKKRLLLVIILLAALGAAAYWLLQRQKGEVRREITLYGNMDLRQVALAFNGSQRIARLLVEEGDHVQPGQELGVLEKDRLEASVLQSQGKVEAQRHAVERLENGTRPEEIAQARANAQSARVDLKNARLRHDRLKKVVSTGAASEQDVDNARTEMDVAEARLEVTQKALDLAVAGPRKEDIAEAKARLRADEAELARLQKELADATLISPTQGVIQNRILEPGEMASPGKPVFTIAVTDPKWARTYVTGPDLGKVRNGMAAAITTDSFPGKRYEGWVGFISPTAEFTPKSVETTELRTALVYEVRVHVRDPSDELRLGMPVTVHLPLAQDGTPSASLENSQR